MDLRNTYESAVVGSHYVVDQPIGEFQAGIEPWKRMFLQLLGISGFPYSATPKQTVHATPSKSET